ESHEGDSAGLWLPALALAGVGAALGLAAAWTGETLVAPAALAMTGEDAEAGLHALPVPGMPLVLSVAGIALGLAAYPARGAIRHVLDSASAAVTWTGDRAYDAAVAGLEWVARAQTVLLQGGRLHVYIEIILVATLALV